MDEPPEQKAKTRRSCIIPVMLAEWVFFLFKTGQTMLDVAARPYILKVVCHLKFQYNINLCNNLDQFPDIEDELQGEDGRDLMYYRVLISLPVILLGLAFDSFKDKCSCKIPLMLPSLANVLSVLFYLLSLKSEKTAILWILLGAFIQGFFGKSSVIAMAILSYNYDITNVDDRTRRIGKLIAMNFLGSFAGALFAGLLQDYANLTVIYLTVVALNVVSVLCTVYCMHDSVPIVKVSTRSSEDSTDSNKSISICNSIREAISVLTMPREHKRRRIIIVLFCLSLVNQACRVGEIDCKLLFVSRSPLSWHESWYGYMMSMDYALKGICLLVLLPLLSNVAKLPDISLVLLSLGTRTIQLFWTGFITETWMMFSVTVVGSLGGMLMSAIRSIMTKIVVKNEIGNVFSLLALAETVAIMTGTVLFVSLYRITAHILPGLTFIVEGTIYLSMFVAICFMYKDFRRVDTLDLLNKLGSQMMY